MSFEVFLYGDELQTDRLPTKTDIENAFAGLIRADDAQFHRLEVGLSDNDSCGIQYGDGDGPRSSLHIDEPVRSDWLWERLYRLIDDFDLFMFWPAETLTAVVAREEVPLIAEMPAKKVIVAGPGEMRDAVLHA